VLVESRARRVGARLQREREAERLRTISAIEPEVEEPDTPEAEIEEREGELIRI
jgi:hypothetical protein